MSVLLLMLQNVEADPCVRQGVCGAAASPSIRLLRREGDETAEFIRSIEFIWIRKFDWCVRKIQRQGVSRTF